MLCSRSVPQVKSSFKECIMAIKGEASLILSNLSFGFSVSLFSDFKIVNLLPFKPTY